MMQVQLDRKAIVNRLEHLRRKDTKRRVFGAAVHNYELQPPLSPSVIEEFEKEHGVTLPEDYRHFITQIGNGGAGPFYGLFPFGQLDDRRTLRSWDEGCLIGEVSQPFPHAAAWNLPDSFWEQQPDPPADIPIEEEHEMCEAWDKLLEEHYWKPTLMNGAIPICHKGCALWQWLVLHGELRGYVWDDMRADYGGIAPVRDAHGNQVTFTDWYLSWLDEAERGGNQQAIATVPYRSLVPRSHRELLTLFLLVVAGVLLGLLVALFRNGP